MRLIEGIADIGGDHFPDVDAFLGAMDDVSATHDTTVQAFDARYVASRRHLERAVELADRERGRGAAIARDRGVEIALYAAGRRQIDRALEMGVSPGETPTVVLVSGGDEDAAAAAIDGLLVSSPTLGAYDETLLREFYDIGETELGATDAGIEALVAERVALLVVER